MFPSNADIRKFIQSYFSDSELETFCFDYFPEVGNEFTVGMLKSNKVVLLLEYCQRRELMANLLAALRKERPKLYDNAFSPLSTLSEKQQDFQLPNMTDQVFICYASEDFELASRIVNSLKPEGYRVWIAPESIHPGEKWVTAINRGLEESSIFLLLITKAAVNSKWVESEVDAAIDMQHLGEMKIIPLLLEPCSLPPLWRSYQHIAFLDSFEEGWRNLLGELENRKSETSTEKRASQDQDRKNTISLLDNSKFNIVSWKLPEPHRILMNHHKLNSVTKQTLVSHVEAIEETLAGLNTPSKVVEINEGPTVIQYLLEPGHYESYDGFYRRTEYEDIVALSLDLAVSLATSNIQVYPLTNRGLVAIDIPKPIREVIGLLDIISMPDFQRVKNSFGVALGLNIFGKPLVFNLHEIHNLLLVGRPGSGLSVMFDTILAGLLLQSTPKDLRILFIDPRMELLHFTRIPHSISFSTTSATSLASSLKWVLKQAELRMLRFQKSRVTNLLAFNLTIEDVSQRLPHIVVLISELSDVINEDPEAPRIISYIASLASKTGIFIVAATKNPAVNVITESLKSSFPTRLLFALRNGEDSERLLGRPGAEKLLGKGDMMAVLPNSEAPLRIQSPYISEYEVEKIISFWSQTKGELKFL